MHPVALIVQLFDGHYTSEMLGKAKIPGLPYENADGSPLVIDIDYFGAKRNPNAPSAGPFENPASGQLKLKVW